MRVLMGTDGSVHASTAMLTAARLLRRQNLEVDVVSVGAELAPAPAGSDRRVQFRFEKRAASQVRKTLDDAQRILAQQHLKTHGLLEFGSPAEKLLQLSRVYELTVVGAYGNHDRTQPGLGPVTSRLLQQGGGNLLIGRELVNENNFRVLAALDSSQASLTALRALATLFDPTSLEVTLMHVIETSWASPSVGVAQDEEMDTLELDEYERQLTRELRVNADAITQSALRQLEQLSIPASAVIREGDPALELCSEAEQGGYDLVVAGATGASDVKHSLLGSVSLKLAWDSPSSVLIVRQPVN